MRTNYGLLHPFPEFAEFGSSESDRIAPERWPGPFDLIHDESNFDRQTLGQARITNQGETEFAGCGGRQFPIVKFPRPLREGWREGWTSPSISPHPQPFSHREKGDQQRHPIKRTKSILVFKVFTAQFAFLHCLAPRLAGRRELRTGRPLCCLKRQEHGRPAREHAQDARATNKPIRGALMCITGDVQKVTVKMSGDSVVQSSSFSLPTPTRAT